MGCFQDSGAGAELDCAKSQQNQGPDDHHEHGGGHAVGNERAQWYRRQGWHHQEHPAAPLGLTPCAGEDPEETQQIGQDNALVRAGSGQRRGGLGVGVA